MAPLVLACLAYFKIQSSKSILKLKEGISNNRVSNNFILYLHCSGSLPLGLYLSIAKIPQDWKLLYFGTSMRRHRISEISQHHRKREYLTSKGTIAGAFAIGIDASVFPDLLMDLNVWARDPFE